jgi:hypothetical protein
VSGAIPPGASYRLLQTVMAFLPNGVLRRNPNRYLGCLHLSRPEDCRQGPTPKLRQALQCLREKNGNCSLGAPRWPKSGPASSLTPGPCIPPPSARWVQPTSNALHSARGTSRFGRNSEKGSADGSVNCGAVGPATIRCPLLSARKAGEGRGGEGRDRLQQTPGSSWSLGRPMPINQELKNRR